MYITTTAVINLYVIAAVVYLIDNISKDFISKLNIALKEAGETDYWLDVIPSAGYFTDDEYDSLKEDNR